MKVDVSASRCTKRPLYMERRKELLSSYKQQKHGNGVLLSQTEESTKASGPTVSSSVQVFIQVSTIQSDKETGKKVKESDG